MEKIVKIFNIVAIVITIISGAIAVLAYINPSVPEIEARIIDKQLLTDKRDSTNNEIWLLQYSIKNVGKRTIIGYGPNSDVLGDGLSVDILPLDSETVSQAIYNNDIDATLSNGKVNFKQWRRNETIEVTAIIESTYEPSFCIDDRGIVDVVVQYKDSKKDKIEIQGALHQLPFPIFLFLRLIYVSFMGLYSAFCIYVIRKNTTKWQLKIMAAILVIILFLGSFAVM